MREFGREYRLPCPARQLGILQPPNVTNVSIPKALYRDPSYWQPLRSSAISFQSIAAIASYMKMGCTWWPEASKKAPMDAARPTHTVDTSGLMCLIVSNTAIPAPHMTSWMLRDPCP